MKILQEMTAVRLLQLKAIKFQPKNPFVWGNGWSAPMYCDDRKILSYPKMRDFIRLELARVIGEMYPDADVIAGIAMNAIAHGVLVAEQLSLPFVYVHPTPKDHGLENQIEGDLRPRQSVVIVENQGAWKAAVHGVARSWTRLSNFTFTFHFHALEKEMATHSSVLAWRRPGMAEPGGLPSMGSH